MNFNDSLQLKKTLWCKSSNLYLTWECLTLFCNILPDFCNKWHSLVFFFNKLLNITSPSWIYQMILMNKKLSFSNTKNKMNYKIDIKIHSK